MAADELRRRVREQIGGRYGPTEHAVAERAGIKPQVLNKFLSTPTRGVDPDTARKLAAHFEWSEVDVFRWAGLLSAPIVLDAAPPLQQVQDALHAGPWSDAVKAAIFTLLRETLPADSLAPGQ